MNYRLVNLTCFDLAAPIEENIYSPIHSGFIEHLPCTTGPYNEGMTDTSGGREIFGFLKQ